MWNHNPFRTAHKYYLELVKGNFPVVTKPGEGGCICTARHKKGFRFSLAFWTHAARPLLVRVLHAHELDEQHLAQKTRQMQQQKKKSEDCRASSKNAFYNWHTIHKKNVSRRKAFTAAA